MSLLQRITFLTYTVVQHSLFLWLHLASVISMSLLQRITFLTYCILYFCGYIWASVNVAVENYIFNLYSCAAFFISVVTSGHLSFYFCGYIWLHLGICHFNVFAVENYIFNLYSCAAFFISVVTSGHVISMSLLQRITLLTYTVVCHSLFLWLHLGICHFNVFAVENYIFNLYSCAAFIFSVVTSGHLSFQYLCCRELHY